MTSDPRAKWLKSVPIFVLSGALKREFGANGSNSVEAGPGDFVYVPKGAVHRESNAAAEPADAIVVRTGVGESTFNCGRAGARLTAASRQPPAQYDKVTRASRARPLLPLGRLRSPDHAAGRATAGEMPP
jgi:Cupin domain